MTAPPERPEATGLGDAPMRAAIISVFASGLCFALVGLAVFGARTGLGVLLGGLIASANLWVFSRVVRAFLDKRGNTAPWAVIAVLKMVFLFGGVWLLLQSGVVSAMALAMGYAALPLGVTLASLFGPSPPETDLPRRGRDVLKGRRSEVAPPAPPDEPSQ